MTRHFNWKECILIILIALIAFIKVHPIQGPRVTQGADLMNEVFDMNKGMR